MPHPEIVRLDARIDGLQESLRAVSDTVVDIQLVVQGHTVILEDHSRILDRHSEMLVEILDRLPPRQ